MVSNASKHALRPLPSRLRFGFIHARIQGIQSFPHHLLRAEVSMFDKIWSQLTFAVSVALSMQALVFLCVPSIVPDNYVLLLRYAEGNPHKCVNCLGEKIILGDQLNATAQTIMEE